MQLIIYYFQIIAFHDPGVNTSVEWVSFLH